MIRQQEYFPPGTLGQRKEGIYHKILSAGDGGLDRKSVLAAMDEYAEIYHTHKCFEAFNRQPTYYKNAKGKWKRLDPALKRWIRIFKYRVAYRWLVFKYWIKRV